MTAPIEDVIRARTGIAEPASELYGLAADLDEIEPDRADILRRIADALAGRSIETVAVVGGRL